ncbi:hypothetical protein J1614_006655 [Plenodomus biglobosus]|nr:hypothetical protein J1614_006655 [Plenodomus biglobosus]
MRATESNELAKTSSREGDQTTFSERLTTLVQIARDANESDHDRAPYHEFLAETGLSLRDGNNLRSPDRKSPPSQVVFIAASNRLGDSKDDLPSAARVSTATQVGCEWARIETLIKKSIMETYRRGWLAGRQSAWNEEPAIRQAARKSEPYTSISNQSNATVDSMFPEYDLGETEKSTNSLNNDLDQPIIEDKKSVLTENKSKNGKYAKTIDLQHFKREESVGELPHASLNHCYSSTPPATMGNGLDLFRAELITSEKTTSNATDKENIAPIVLLKDPFQSLVALARMK